MRIGPGIEEGEPSSCGGAPRGVVLGRHKILSPPCVLRSQNLPIAESRAVSPRAEVPSGVERHSTSIAQRRGARALWSSSWTSTTLVLLLHSIYIRYVFEYYPRGILKYYVWSYACYDTYRIAISLDLDFRNFIL
jgi:hypothetical protein